MKESPKRYINPLLSDEENDKVKSWNNEKVNVTNNLEHENLGKTSEYIDKNVTCYEESGFQAVKDICVDEGLSYEEKIECDKEHHKLSCNPVSVNEDNLEKQLISSQLEDCYKVDELDSNNIQNIEIFGPEKSTQNCEEELDSNSNSNSNSNLTNNKDQLLTTINQQLPEAQSAEPEPQIPNEINATLNSETVKPTTASGPHEIQLDTQTAPNRHNMTVAVSQLQHGGGESSFSMVGPVSGLITLSGPIASAGSISHRSDGSNTSVRSFAFPILQNEWNSSPVRMAKADPRGTRKHQGWRQALMCCKF